ncbi:MAG: sensor histidine kinase [Longibaculum sp.]
MFFYTSMYYIIYSIVITLLIYGLSLFNIIQLLELFEPSFVRFILVFIFNGMSIGIYYFLLKKLVIPEKNIVDEHSQVLCVGNISTIYVYTIAYWFNKTGNENIYIYVFLYIFIGLWLFLLYTLNNSFLMSHKNQEFILMNSIYQSIQQYIRQYEQDKEEIHKIRHDMKNQLTIIRELTNDNKVKQYINQIYPQLINNEIFIKEVSGNIYVDAIINAKKMEYLDLKIDCHINITNLNMNSMDLCTLVFNLLDNACEAAQKYSGVVTFEMLYLDSNLTITTRNNCNGILDFKSKKGKGHGYGLKIIKGIVRKYEGVMEVNLIDNELIIKIGMHV